VANRLHEYRQLKSFPGVALPVYCPAGSWGVAKGDPPWIPFLFHTLLVLKFCIEEELGARFEPRPEANLFNPVA